VSIRHFCILCRHLRGSSQSARIGMKRRLKYTHRHTNHARRNTMNALKHMEAVFVIALSVAGIGSYLAATAQDAHAAAAAVQASAPQMAVVTVVGKRLSPAEKAASLRAEMATTVVASR
jgi:hypothetical protein